MDRLQGNFVLFDFILDLNLFISFHYTYRHVKADR